MDTSETYIKMSDCPEIQEGHKWEDGDWGYWPKNGDINIITGGDYYTVEQAGEGYLWLPRQDQLQEMVESEETKPELIVIDKLAHFACWERYTQEYPFTSREQLELAFVMKEHYSKVWNGTAWYNGMGII